LNSVVQNASNRFIAVGTDGPNYDPAVLFEASEHGELLSSRSFSTRDICQIFTEVSICSDGTYLIVGQGGDFASKSILMKFSDPNSIETEGDLKIPERFALSAYPNPFNSTLNIGFSGPMNREATRIEVFDPLGRKVASLFDGLSQAGRLTYAGEERIVWNAEGLPAGKYVIYLEAGNQRASQSVTLLK